MNEQTIEIRRTEPADYQAVQAILSQPKAISGTLQWTIEQGRDMGRLSRLELEADKKDGLVTGVRVGGNSVIVSQGAIDVPDGL